ncbi:uncharacterized protein LOC100904367 [Galendromus occidentalis]|uniref:Uncharacterized protein LOC100904367 n=1 Tax=Galendromus occidentalis TaxID=34638 RepID=A0AAJ7PA42_9ACAR|nr:uncharacterized protein LOC100904367 [Galendromus occidentalis]
MVSRERSCPGFDAIQKNDNERVTFQNKVLTKGENGGDAREPLLFNRPRKKLPRKMIPSRCRVSCILHGSPVSPSDWICYGTLTRAEDTAPYLPYQFQYSIEHPEGGQSSRVEKGNRDAVTGSYQITTADGLKRIVNYVADGSGFRAFVDSNEPGVKSGEYPAPDNAGKEYVPDRTDVAPAPASRALPVPGFRKIQHVHETPLYQEVPVRTAGRTYYQDFIPQEFSPQRPLHVVSNAQPGLSFPPRQGRKLEDVDAVSPVLTLRPDPREERGLPQQEPVSEQVAHSPTLYFNTPNKEEEGGAIITKNNLNPPVKFFPPGSGIAQRGRPFQPSVPQIQNHHPKNYPVQNPSELLSVDVQPVDKRLGDLLPDFEDVHHPYEFKFSSGLHGHKQSGDSTGKVKGEYYLRGHDGQLRKVVYEADKNGFRAHVDSNEFGIVSHKPNNATITRTGKLPQYTGFYDRAPDNVHKPERALERPPRPSVYVGHDVGLLIDNNGRFQDPESWRQPQQSFVPASISRGNSRREPPRDQGIDTSGKFDSRRKPERPTDPFTDLKQRPENLDIVEPVAPQSPQRVHPGSRSRQTFAPINAREEQPGNRPSAPRQYQTPSIPSTPTVPNNPRSDRERPNRGFPAAQRAVQNDGTVRVPEANTPSRNYRERNAENVPINTSERLREPYTPVQRGDFRQPHHGPGFGYQFSTSHDQEVAEVPPRFSRLDNPQLPPAARTPQRDATPNAARSPPSGLNFNFGSQVVQQPPTDRVPARTGNRSPFEQADQRPFREDPRRGRLLVPAVIIEEKNDAPSYFDGTYQPLRDPPPQRNVAPPQARAFGRPASPNLKTPASEALRSGPGATVSPAPIKKFGPPAATPLPSEFQGPTSSELNEATPTPSTGDVTTRHPNAARAGKSSPLLRMYDNGVVIGGPEPQKINYDPINDNPARQGRNLNDGDQHSGYAPRNFGPVYYNNVDQINHYSNFAETSEPNRNARVVHETVTHQVEVPKFGPTTSSPLDRTAFSPADGADLMSFAVRKVSRRRRRKQRYQNQQSVQPNNNERKLPDERGEFRSTEQPEYPTARRGKQLSIPRFERFGTSNPILEQSPERQVPIYSPYKFGFDDRYDGGRIARHEEYDGTGRVSGFYTIEDPDGRRRLVKYVADENGFRAHVLTNEQGTDNQDPAQIKVYSTSPHYVPQHITFNGVPLVA